MTHETAHVNPGESYRMRLADSLSCIIIAFSVRLEQIGPQGAALELASEIQKSLTDVGDFLEKKDEPIKVLKQKLVDLRNTYEGIATQSE